MQSLLHGGSAHLSFARLNKCRLTRTSRLLLSIRMWQSSCIFMNFIFQVKRSLTQVRVHEHISAMFAWVPNIPAPLIEHICYVFQSPKTACMCVRMEVRSGRVPSDPEMSIAHCRRSRSLLLLGILKTDSNRY